MPNLQEDIGADGPAAKEAGKFSVIFLGSDHAGYALKQLLLAELAEAPRPTEDLGCFDESRCDYPDVAHLLAERVASTERAQGLLLCGTGVGMAMAANRHANIRAVVCSESFSARMAREHNDANVLCLGSRVVGAAHAVEITQAFLAATFSGGRHVARVRKMETT